MGLSKNNRLLRADGLFQKGSGTTMSIHLQVVRAPARRDAARQDVQITSRRKIGRNLLGYRNWHGRTTELQMLAHTSMIGGQWVLGCCCPGTTVDDCAL
jgi:hypothetical protein